MSKLYQRLSQDMHCDNDQTNFTLLHSSWCIELRSEKRTNDQNNTDQKETEMRSRTKKKSVTCIDSDQRRNIKAELWKLLNISTSDDCIHNMKLNFFQDEVYQTSIYIKLRSCCSSYDLNSQTFIASHNELIKDSEKDSLRRSWLCCQLQEWWAEKTLRMFLTDYMNYCSSLIMFDSILEFLTNWAEYIHDESSLQRWVKDEWSDFWIYYLEIIIILKQSHSMNFDADEIFNEWKRVNNIKRNKISDSNANNALMNFNN